MVLVDGIAEMMKVEENSTTTVQSFIDNIKDTQYSLLPSPVPDFLND